MSPKYLKPLQVCKKGLYLEKDGNNLWEQTRVKSSIDYKLDITFTISQPSAFITNCFCLGLRKSLWWNWPAKNTTNNWQSYKGCRMADEKGIEQETNFGLMSVSELLSTYPSLNPTSTLTCYQLTVIGLWGVKMYNWSYTDIDSHHLCLPNLVLLVTQLHR